MIKKHKKNYYVNFFCLLIAILCISACTKIKSELNTVDWYKTYGINSKDDLNNPSSIPSIVKALSSTNAYVRIKAANSLSNMGPTAKEAMPYLIPVLNDRSGHVRIASIRALAKIGSKEAIPYMLPMISDPNGHVRLAVIRELYKIGHYSKPLADILTFVAQSDNIPVVKAEAAKTLRKITLANLIQNRSPLKSADAFQKLQNDKQATLKSSNLKSGLLSNSITKWAVIIGISRYQFSEENGIKNLIFADEDAFAFARTLIKLGWNENHIKQLVNENATKRNIAIALESWLTKAGPNDQITLFWAGHAHPNPEDPEKVYFACYDTDLSIPSTGYRMDKVRTALEEIGSKNVILFADTCHAGKIITRGKRAISIITQIDKMNREQEIPKGWVFMVGADTDRQAIEHTSWKNGAFTHSLIKGLSGEADGFQSSGPKNGLVTMGELKNYMNVSMPNETQKVLGVAKRPVIITGSSDPGIWNLTLQVR